MIGLVQRYKVIPQKLDRERIVKFYDTDAADELAYLEEKFVDTKFFQKSEHIGILKKFRARFKRSRRGSGEAKE